MYFICNIAPGPPGPPGRAPMAPAPPPGPPLGATALATGFNPLIPGPSVPQPPQPPQQQQQPPPEIVPPVFVCPRRPNIGTEGRIITLRANHFQITMPRGFLHHYDITITPDKCPRKINRYVYGLLSLFLCFQFPVCN